MHNSAELALGIRAVERQFMSASLREDVKVVSNAEPTPDDTTVSGIYHGSMPKPEIIRGYQYGLPQEAQEQGMRSNIRTEILG